jgi:hypothetical protein
LTFQNVPEKKKNQINNFLNDFCRGSGAGSNIKFRIRVHSDEFTVVIRLIKISKQPNKLVQVGAFTVLHCKNIGKHFIAQKTIYFLKDSFKILLQRSVSGAPVRKEVLE